MLVEAPAHTVGEDAPLANVTRLLVEQDLCAVPVVDETAALCGVITSIDLLAAGTDWTAADAMSFAHAVRANTCVEAVVDLMAREHAQCVVVTDAARHVVGVVTARQLLKISPRNANRAASTKGA